MPVIVDNKNPSLPSVFRPAAPLREARRQKGDEYNGTDRTRF
jgi:hypothetical protein